MQYQRWRWSDVRLIDANALEVVLRERLNDLVGTTGWHDHYVTGFDDAITYVEDAPSVDAVEVVHGYWIANNICSVCWKGIIGWAIQNGYKFCPYCGVKMDAKCINVPTKNGGESDAP